MKIEVTKSMLDKLQNSKKICIKCGNKIKDPYSRLQRYCKKCWKSDIELNKKGGTEMPEKKPKQDIECIVCKKVKKRSEAFIKKLDGKPFTCALCLRKQKK